MPHDENCGDGEFLKNSGLVDPAFYLQRYPDVRSAGVDPIQHYLEWGAKERRRPHPFFDAVWYLAHNPDVALSGVNPVIHYLQHGRNEGRRGQKLAAVYTAIVGNYDDLRSPARIDPELDYFVFGDDWVVDPPEPWIRMPLPWSEGGPRLAARFVKTHGPAILPGYEIWFWADASFQLRNVCAKLLEEIVQHNPIAFFAHPERDCAYSEAETVRARSLDSDNAIERIVRQLELHEFPRSAGLAATGMLIQRHDERLERAMGEWWRLIENGSQRDQLSFNLVLWRNQVPYNVIPGSIWLNNLGDYKGHRPAPWQGLQCGGACLDAAEYEAIETMVHSFGIRTAIEIGSGETSILFARLGVRTISLEYRTGPWLRRAHEHGCNVVEVRFDSTTSMFDPLHVAALLKGFDAVDLVFIDSPIGTQNRSRVVECLLGHVSVKYVLYHDARRDAVNLVRDQQRFCLRLIQFVESERGLALFEIGGARRRFRLYRNKFLRLATRLTSVSKQILSVLKRRNRP